MCHGSCHRNGHGGEPQYAGQRDVHLYQQNMQNEYSHRGHRRTPSTGGDGCDRGYPGGGQCHRRSASTDAGYYGRKHDFDGETNVRSPGSEGKDSLGVGDGGGGGRRWSDAGLGRVYFDGYDKIYYYNSEENISHQPQETPGCGYDHQERPGKYEDDRYYSTGPGKQSVGSPKREHFLKLAPGTIIQPIISGVQLEPPECSRRRFFRGEIPDIYVTSPTTGRRKIFLDDESYQFSHLSRSPFAPPQKSQWRGTGGVSHAWERVTPTQPPPYGRPSDLDEAQRYFSEEELVTHAYMISPGKKHTTFDSEPTSPRRTLTTEDSLEYDISPSSKRKKVYFDETETVYDIDDEVIILDTTDNKPVIKLSQKPQGILRKTSKYASREEEDMEEDDEMEEEREDSVDEEGMNEDDEEESKDGDEEMEGIEKEIYKSPFTETQAGVRGLVRDVDEEDDILYGPESDIDMVRVELELLEEERKVGQKHRHTFLFSLFYRENRDLN